jgi:succinate dehydrogenase / fumarate reductase, cytochrome b subunit
MQASINNPHFLLRRLQSLLGLLPVGLFLLFHLWENSQSRFGAEHYNEQVVGWLQGLNYLTILEIVVIFMPLLFHAGYGLIVLRGGSDSDWRRFPWLHHRLYLLQRISGVGILLFLLFHVGWTRVWGLFEPTVKADLYGHMQGLLSQLPIFLLYLAGLLFSTFHLSNGLWTIGISWGLTTSEAAQRYWFVLCSLLFFLLSAMGLHGMLGFVL